MKILNLNFEKLKEEKWRNEKFNDVQYVWDEIEWRSGLDSAIARVSFFSFTLYICCILFFNIIFVSTYTILSGAINFTYIQSHPTSSKFLAPSSIIIGTKDSYIVAWNFRFNVHHQEYSKLVYILTLWIGAWHIAFPSYFSGIKRLDVTIW